MLSTLPSPHEPIASQIAFESTSWQWVEIGRIRIRVTRDDYGLTVNLAKSLAEERAKAWAEAWAGAWAEAWAGAWAEALGSRKSIHRTEMPCRRASNVDPDC